LIGAGGPEQWRLAARLSDVARKTWRRARRAKQTYRASLEIFERLAKVDPENVGGQLLRALSHQKIGSVLAQQGNQTAALESYRSAFTIANHLARLDPDNVGLQDDLAVSHHRIGKGPQALGKLAAAFGELSRLSCHHRAPGQGRAWQ
jgi:tetratricopeptide (TPR) repeat protein